MRSLSIALAFLLAASPIVAKPLRVGGEVKAPVLVKTVEPKLPEKVRVAGPITFSTIIDKAGKLRKIRVLRDSTRSPAFGTLYMEAMKQWEFKPATLHGKPVEVYYYLTINIDVQ
jgi:TonB family protein